MATKRKNNSAKCPSLTLRSRVSAELKERVTNYRNRPEVKRSEGFVVRQAVEDFLNVRETQVQPEKPVQKAA